MFLLYRWCKNTNSTMYYQNLINIYGAHQIYNNVLISYIRHLIILAITFISLIMISMTYALIGFYDKLGATTLIPVMITCTVAYGITEIWFKMAATLTKASKDFSSSHLRNNFKIEKANKIRLKACRALYIDIGKTS